MHARLEESEVVGKVLVAEDESFIRMMLVDALEEEGFTVLEAENAADAMSLFEQNEDVQVLVSDIRMPGAFDGIELAGWVRSTRPSVKVVLASGYVSGLDRNALGATVDLFVSKPYRVDGLIEQVRSLL